MGFLDLIDSNIWGIDILENYSFAEISKSKFIVYLKTQDVLTVYDEGQIFDFNFIENKEQILNKCYLHYEKKGIFLNQEMLNDLSENLDNFKMLALKFLDTKFSIEYDNEQDLFICENINFTLENLIKNRQFLCSKNNLEQSEFNEKLLYSLIDEKYKLCVEYDFENNKILLTTNSQNIKYFYKKSFLLSEFKDKQNDILNNFFLEINSTICEQEILIPYLESKIKDIIYQSNFYTDIEKNNENFSLKIDKKLNYNIKKYENNIKIYLFFNNLYKNYIILDYENIKNNLDNVTKEILKLIEKTDFEVTEYEIYETLTNALDEINSSLQKFSVTLFYDFFNNIFYFNKTEYSPNILLNSTEELAKKLFQNQDENLKQKFSKQEILDTLNHEIYKIINNTFDLQIKDFNESKIIEMKGKISYSKMYQNRNVFYNTRFIVNDFFENILIDENIKLYLKETLFLKLNNLKIYCK